MATVPARELAERILPVCADAELVKEGDGWHLRLPNVRVVHSKSLETYPVDTLATGEVSEEAAIRAVWLLLTHPDYYVSVARPASAPQHAPSDERLRWDVVAERWSAWPPPPIMLRDWVKIGEKV